MEVASPCAHPAHRHIDIVKDCPQLQRALCSPLASVADEPRMAVRSSTPAAVTQLTAHAPLSDGGAPVCLERQARMPTALQSLSRHPHRLAWHRRLCGELRLLLRVRTALR